MATNPCGVGPPCDSDCLVRGIPGLEPKLHPKPWPMRGLYYPLVLGAEMGTAQDSAQSALKEQEVEKFLHELALVARDGSFLVVGRPFQTVPWPRKRVASCKVHRLLTQGSFLAWESHVASPNCVCVCVCCYFRLQDNQKQTRRGVAKMGDLLGC